MNKRCWLLAGLVVALWAIGLQSARAWGPAGHRIVAHIAEDQLAPGILAELRREFSIKHLANVANWADAVKRKRKTERMYHYVNIAEGARTYVARRDCPQGDCVTAKIKEFEGVLTMRRSPFKARQRAFRYLVHLVADAHQPLHTGNAADRGGNEIFLTFQGRPTNLHALWDHGLIPLDGQSERRLARRLSRQITREERRQWSRATPEDWTSESRGLALDHAYRLRTGPGNEPDVAYLEEGRRIVARQLQRAGVRLAARLTGIYRGGSPHR